MNGALLDHWLSSLQGGQTQKRSLGREMALVPTSAGLLRVLDSGGDRPAILLTPDGPCVIEHYLELIETLRDSFRVICFDMPGFGFSFPGRRYRLGIEETADAIIELMDASSVSSAILAFSCANGFFALNLALRYPDRVNGLILSQTPSLDSMRRWADRIVPKPLHIPFVGQIAMAAAAKRFAGGWFDIALPRDSEQKTFFIERAQQAVSAGGRFCLASLVQGLAQGENGDVQTVDCPVLAIHGDKDFSHKHTDFSSLKTHIPHARLDTFEGCGHFPDLERQDHFSGLVRRFADDRLNIR